LKAETTGTDPAALDSFESPDAAQGGNPLDDYTNGEYVGGSLAPENELDPNGMYELDNFIPTVDEVILQRPEAINHLDILDKKYGQSMDDLTALKKGYQDAINSGQLSKEEAESLVMKMELIDAAKAKGETQRARCAELATGLAAEYLEEMRTCSLIGPDQWLGRPHEEGSYYKHIRDDGTEIWLDHTGKPAILPIIDPDYQASITSSNTMVIADEWDTLGSHYPSGSVDRTITFNGEGALSNDNFFGCPISMGIPRAFWVHKAEDASDGMGNNYATKGPNGEFKADIYDQWSADGMTQLTPEDMSQYMQVKVTKVEIVSEPLDYLVEGNDDELVYDHYVVYKNGENVLARVRIVGQGGSIDSGAKTLIKPNGGGDERYYTAASSLGFEIVGDNLDVEVDAHDFISTCRHVVDPGKFIAATGIEKPTDEQAKRAFNENIGFFTDKSWNISQWDPEGQVWQNSVDGPIPNFDSGTYEYGDNYNDRYLSLNQEVSEESPVDCYQTGIFMTGVRGKIHGSNQSDVIMCHGANDFSDYDKENIPGDDQNRVPGDAFYDNMVNGNGGNNVFVGGRGNNIVNSVTFAWLKDGGHDDENWIDFPKRPGGNGYDVENLPNQKCFFHGEGGTNNIHNPLEYDNSEDMGEDPDGGDEGKFIDANATDDYYECTSGNMNFGDKDDPNIDGNAHGICSFDEGTIQGLWDTIEPEWDDAINSVPGAEYLDEISEEWMSMFQDGDGNSYSDTVKEEMDGFFDEAFNGLDESFDFDTETEF